MNAFKPDHSAFPSPSTTVGSSTRQPTAGRQPRSPQTSESGQRSRSRTRSRQHPNRILAIEASAKLGINVFLAVMAVTALVKLIPFNLGQEESLKELRGKVSEVQGRVDTLQADFNYHFDPQQTMNAMQEQSVRTIPGQRQIVLVEPNSNVAESLPQTDRNP